ncbi:hypothetical protein MUDAN_BIHEEGNE_03126 [Lactiplantibacillus mudanjiangensis]|uniref:hypothetical protein n=1 Tax=Lactiplantibacillus mudanjiangensis TaxID=1296538 RepID=UPI00101592A2|nr:hypothetical protein MUDAN_BIHEEGNE_03126 [Lactiplantibacillus mudanjiangensis]
MAKLLTKEQIQQAYDQYLADHADEINVLITKKIESAVKSSIAEAFASGRGYDNQKGWAAKQVTGLVDEKIKAATNSKTVVVDLDNIQNKINSTIQRKLKKLDVDITI